ncbi:MAG: TrkA C-terminal domain-containing protein [Nitrospiraceae bacterium]|nr:TrkA C-terminal domain-containing protein [Nitrospiraceae bacterium]
MLSFELLARIRKELSLTGSALYESILAIAERVNRKVHVLRLHGQATSLLTQIRTIHRQVGQRVATRVADPARPHADLTADPALPPLDDLLRNASDRIKAHRLTLQQVETHIRELKEELVHDELLKIQRDLGVHGAAIERLVVAQGAPVIGHPIGEFDLPATMRLAAVFRGPFLLPLSDSVALRAEDIVVLIGLREDLARWAPHFQGPVVSSRTA